MIEKYGLLLAKLSDDRTSGAEQLVASALDIIRMAVGDEGVSDNELANILDEIVGIIRTKFNELAPMSGLATSISALSRDNLRESAGELERELRKKIAMESLSLARIGANLIPQNSTVTTISHSETVLNVLSKTKGLARDFHVIAAISEPSGEGRITAKSLADMGIDVTLVPDGAIGYAVERSNIVVVGADAVAGEFFINKIGTFPMALAAKHFNVPFYVCARLDKFTPSRNLPKSRRVFGPEELKPPESKLITAQAPLFERIPLSLVEGIVTESGIVKPHGNRIEIPEIADA
ncbi:MAG TPA: hypothetical protein ENN07_03210 [candidate division Zixibacteria bacterium]|nr:hypothetical protein [candidate division Zixibacteria bacterium]